MIIRREIKAYIEAELRDYNDTLRQIGEDREELLHEGHCPDSSGIRGTGISNPTHNRALKLMTNKRIRRMEETCRAISTVIDALPEEKYTLVELKYWTKPQTLTDIGISQKLHIGKTTFYEWCNEIIAGLGVEMGLINAVDAEKKRSFKGA